MISSSARSALDAASRAHASATGEERRLRAATASQRRTISRDACTVSIRPDRESAARSTADSRVRDRLPQLDRAPDRRQRGRRALEQLAREAKGLEGGRGDIGMWVVTFDAEEYDQFCTTSQECRTRSAPSGRR